MLTPGSLVPALLLERAGTNSLDGQSTSVSATGSETFFSENVHMYQRPSLPQRRHLHSRHSWGCQGDWVPPRPELWLRLRAAADRQLTRGFAHFLSLSLCPLSSLLSVSLGFVYWGKHLICNYIFHPQKKNPRVFFPVCFYHAFSWSMMPAAVVSSTKPNWWDGD